MIGILTAMTEEMQYYKDHFHLTHDKTKAGIDFFRATHEGKEIVVVKSGIGKVNSTIATQLLIDDYKISHMICTGVAGGLNPDLDIGDVVVSKDCMHHDMHLDFLGFERGQVPYTDLRFFEGDKALREAAQHAKIEGKQIIEGRILTGDNFIQDQQYMDEVRKELDGDCIEMEGAAVAQTCVLNGNVPFVVVRSISDRADHEAKVDFPKFMAEVAQHAFIVVKTVIERIEV